MSGARLVVIGECGERRGDANDGKEGDEGDEVCWGFHRNLLMVWGA